MKARRLGLEWGGAYEVAQPTLVTSDSLAQVLLFEPDGGGLVVEIPLGCGIHVSESTMTEHTNKGKGEYVLVITIENGFDYVPKPRK